MPRPASGARKKLLPAAGGCRSQYFSLSTVGATLTPRVDGGTGVAGGCWGDAKVLPAARKAVMQGVAHPSEARRTAPAYSRIGILEGFRRLPDD
jgi:hypothetical protein